MSNISTEHKEKLQQLIYSDEFESVVQGLELLDTLVEDEKDIYNVFDLRGKIPSNIDKLEKGIFDCEFKNDIKVWMLGKLAEYHIDWVCNLTSLSLEKNQFTTLPESIGNLTLLELLNLHNNPITDVEGIRLKQLFGDNVKF